MSADDCSMYPPKFCVVWFTKLFETSALGYRLLINVEPVKFTVSSITQPRFARLCSNLTLVHYGALEVAESSRSTSGYIQDSERPRFFNL